MPAPEITGTLTLSGPMFGEATLTPDRCTSGEHEVFLGADFANAASPLVARLVVDPLTGAGVRVFDREARFTRALVLRREECSRFELSLARKNWQLNEIYGLQVMVDIDCRLPSGDSVVGKLSASSCW